MKEEGEEEGAVFTMGVVVAVWGGGSVADEFDVEL